MSDSNKTDESLVLSNTHEQKNMCQHEHVKVKKEYSHEEHEYLGAVVGKYARVKCDSCNHEFLGKKNQGSLSGSSYLFKWHEVPLIDPERCKHSYFDVDLKQKFVEKFCAPQNVPRFCELFIATEKWQEGIGRCIFCDRALPVYKYYAGKKEEVMKNWRQLNVK